MVCFLWILEQTPSRVARVLKLNSDEFIGTLSLALAVDVEFTEPPPPFAPPSSMTGVLGQSPLDLSANHSGSHRDSASQSSTAEYKAAEAPMAPLEDKIVSGCLKLSLVGVDGLGTGSSAPPTVQFQLLSDAHNGTVFSACDILISDNKLPLLVLLPFALDGPCGKMRLTQVFF
jgi:hypothetical protein